MEWLIHAIAVWIAFLLLVNWKEFKVNLWCGLLSIAIQMTVDTFFKSLGLYHTSGHIISVWGSPLFFIIGTVFCIGSLISQYQPRKRWARVFITCFLASVFMMEEFLLVVRGQVVYVNWNIGYSFIIDLITMIVLGWFAIAVLNRGGAKT